MKSLQESLLDDEDVLMDNTDMINKNFPSKQDIKKTKTWTTEYYYRWHDPELFKILYKDIAFDKKIMPLETIQIQISYDPVAANPGQRYIFTFKLEGKNWRSVWTYFIDYSKSYKKAIDVIYEILTIIKNNPKALKYINGFIKKNNPMPTDEFFKKFR